MYVNQIDELIDNILNNFNNFLIKNKAFEKIKYDTNFVIYQLDILKYIDEFMKILLKNNDILNIIKNENNYNIILNIIKKYCAFYIYLGIAYYYEGNRDLFITNLIETCRYQKDTIIQIPDFFNSESNSKLIIFYNDIKNLLSLFQFKTIDKIKIVLQNNIIKYDSTIKLFNDIGEDYINDFFLITDNFHNILKTIIIKQLYINHDKNNIITFLGNIDKESAEYKYIDIIISNKKKIVDINIIQKFVALEQSITEGLKYKNNLAEEIYEYIETYKLNSINEITENENFIDYLFTNKILIPITEELLRYHKDTEKYDNDQIDNKNRENTKIKYINNKVNLIINYYSPITYNNAKLKIETKELFFKPLEPRLAILYNNNEELKIIQKYDGTQKASDFDLLLDIYNIRKYSYINFKNSLFNVLKLRPSTSISSIRNTNILNKNNLPLELRIGNSNVDINIIGVALNPSNKSLNCYKNFDLINVNNNSENGFKLFIKKMFKTINNKKYNKLYYWIFNSKTDKPILKTYTDYGNNITKNISILLNEIYNYYIQLINKDIFNTINKFEELNEWYFDKILDYYKKKYYDFNNNIILKNNIYNYVYLNKIKDYKIIYDDIEDFIPGKNNKNIIKLPSIDYKKYQKNIIKLREINIEIDITELNKNLPLCHHYIKWDNITKMSKKSDNYNQSIFNFVKQYVRLTEQNEYICKSCGEGVQIQKFVDTTYVSEMDELITTSIGVVNQRLEDIPKYSKYIKSIRNIDKNIEKFCYKIELISYLGNTPVIKLKRRIIIKDTIDLILLHSEWLRKQPKNRIILYSKKYGINPDLTNLFFFEFKDDIFLTSSIDTDYYKIIKYNNIIAYMILIIISELNLGQILNFREDKTYNFIYFNKIYNSLFNELYLRVGQKEKISFLKLPLFSYILYYFSGMLISNRIWLYNNTNIEKSQLPIFIINLQKSIIHTIIDLLNTITEANLEENKNFFYEIINTRLNIKINFTFNNLELIKKIENKFNKNIKFDETTKKMQIITKKIELINLNTPFNILIIPNNKCDLLTYKLNTTNVKKINFTFNNLTNCEDGKFHKWNFKSNDLICNLCNKSYNELLKNKILSPKTFNSQYLDKIKFINLQQLAYKYCITGEIHTFNSSGECIKCKINKNKINFNSNELLKLESNFNNIYNKQILNNINNIKIKNDLLIKEYNININNINDFNKLFNIKTNNNINSYINNFILKLINILGNKINIQNNVFYLNETMYIINHDYLGNILKNNIIILSSDNKMITTNTHPLFNFSIIYYKNKLNNIYVYYDLLTLQYIGYSEDNKIIKKTINNVSLIIKPSLFDELLYLGYENQYYNIYYINKDFINFDIDTIKDIINKDNYDIISNLLRTRIINLKQIILRTQSIILNLKNKNKHLLINNEEKNLINEFLNKINIINITNVFDFKNIFDLLYFDNIIPNITFDFSKNYININSLINIINTDTKLLFYLINNLSLLLDNNTQVAIKTELAYLIIKIIKYLYNFYYRPINNLNIRMFNFLLINEIPYIDEKLSVVGIYNELITHDEMNNNDPNNDIKNDIIEANEALDIDDYELNDDIDEVGEILVTFD